MTPTPLVLVLVALLWTLPASFAAVSYRQNGYSVDAMMSSLKETVGLPQPELQPQPDA